ncbi:MAG: flagellar hook capping FlgD N-terminal domain-containing protein [Actinomycetota bacterium]|jgi:flagellar basal-body rod modification protein FlgD|nr:flagellar hook capping FlgD N-terminal domain-containing protein [Actinomycetota bacterium]
MITSIPSDLTNEGVANQTGLGELGSETFLKLLVAQLQNQNPMEPMDGSQMLQQTAQFANVEAMQRLTDLQGRLLGVQNFTASSNLIGQQVTAFIPGEGDIQGLVEAVTSGETGAVLRINGRDVALDHVVRVDEPPASVAT